MSGDPLPSSVEQVSEGDEYDIGKCCLVSNITGTARLLLM
jgi:hypothetical protein